MNTIHLHRSAGLSITKINNEEIIYLNKLEQVAQDAEISLDWPEASLLRIFPLSDGRIAVVRETANGLSQETASPNLQAFYQLIADKAEKLIAKEAERKALETPVNINISDEV